MNFPSRFCPFGIDNKDVKRFTSNRKNKRLSGSQRRKLSKQKKRNEFRTSNWSNRSWNESYNEPYNLYPPTSFQMSCPSQPCPYFDKAPPINFEDQFNSPRSSFINFEPDDSNIHEEMPISNFQDEMPESIFSQGSLENPNQLSSTPKVEKDLINEKFNEDDNTSESTELFRNPFYENIKTDDIPFKVKVTIVNDQLNNVLTEKQGRLIQSKIIEAVDSISQNDFAPQFVTSFFVNHELYIVCANNQTVTWLSHTVKHLSNLWEGAKLRVALPLSERKKTLIRVPSHESPNKILRRFSIQNPDLRINCWSLIGRKFHKGGQTLFLLIDIYSLNKIKASNYKVFWGLGTIVFKIAEKSKKKVNEQIEIKKVNEQIEIKKVDENAENNQEVPLQNNKTLLLQSEKSTSATSECVKNTYEIAPEGIPALNA